MLQSGEKYDIYYGPERTCLGSRYHAIYGRDTTDQNEHVFAVYIIQFNGRETTDQNEHVCTVYSMQSQDVQGDNNSHGSVFFNSPSR